MTGNKTTEKNVQQLSDFLSFFFLKYKTKKIKKIILLFFDKLSARGSSDVTVGDVGQLWTSLGLERQRLDDLLELVSIATTPTTTGETDETKEDDPEAAKEPRYDPATVVDWNKLLALAAGQLGDVNKFFFLFS